MSHGITVDRWKGKYIRMNKRVFIIFLISVFLSAASAADVFAYEKTDITVYIFDKDHTTTFHCISANDMPVPYVDVEEYLDSTYTIDFRTERLSDGTYKISNKNGFMIVDPGNDTIHFDQFEMFLYNECYIAPDYPEQTKFTKNMGIEYSDHADPFDMDLKKYHIDIIEQDKKVYLPLSTISDITCITYNTAVYADGEISVNFADSTPFVGCNIDQNPDVPRKESEIRYSYDELCFLMDCLYGCPSSCILAESIENRGFDRTLDEYNEDTRYIKRLLNSENIIDYMFGAWSLSGLLYDGGHTGFCVMDYDSELAPAVYNAFNEVFNDHPDDPRLDLYWRCTEEQKNRQNKMFEIQNWLSGYDSYKPVFQETEDADHSCSYYEYDDTGIYAFNSIYNDGCLYLKRALDLAKEHGIKNFVLDISHNVGGDDSLTTYFLSMIGEGNRLYFEGSRTHNKTEVIFDFDLDQDGVFEQSDESNDYHFNYAVLCSRRTFSNGNTIACRAKEAGIPILGEKSGGGTCNLILLRTPQGFVSNIAAGYKYTYKKGGDMEDGAEPDYDLTKLTPDGKTDYSDFYNYELIDSILDKHYSSEDNVEPGPSPITVSDNKPMAVSTETRGDSRISYAHEIPFYWKGKLTPESFGGITVSEGDSTYKVTKIKANKKRKRFRITGLEGADRETVKKIKKATKGSNGLPFKCNPYYVRNTDSVKLKFKKNGDLKSVKVLINDKYYKAKKGEWSYDSDKKEVLFTGANLNGSYKN